MPNESEYPRETFPAYVCSCGLAACLILFEKFTAGACLFITSASWLRVGCLLITAVGGRLDTIQWLDGTNCQVLLLPGTLHGATLEDVSEVGLECSHTTPILPPRNSQ